MWGLGFLSDPHCILTIGQQEVRSKRDSDTSIRGKAGNPVWNQDFFFLIEDPFTQKLVVQVTFFNRSSILSSNRQTEFLFLWNPLCAQNARFGTPT